MNMMMVMWWRIKIFGHTFQPQMKRLPLMRLKLKLKKCGPDGISPDVFKFLHANWLPIVTTLFNSVFTSANYPELDWSEIYDHFQER